MNQPKATLVRTLAEALCDVIWNAEEEDEEDGDRYYDRMAEQIITALASRGVQLAAATQVQSA